MSSDDSDFDKEAEREKLRKQYEQDKKDRENTQRMSELLLQGATMTGKHCGNCGDPIFRYDGQEFCPTCQREVEDGAGEAADGDDAERAADAEHGSERAENAEHAENADEAARADATGSGGEPRVEINDVRVADRHADSTPRSPPTEREADRRNATADRAGRRQPSSRTDAETPHAHGSAANRDAARSAGESSGDLGAARASLVRTLDDLARRAEATDDVSRARELLAATREAAEALAALDRAGR